MAADGRLILVAGTTLLDIPTAAMGVGDVIMAASKREPTRGYAIAETIISVPTLVLSGGWTIDILSRNRHEDALTLAVISVAMSSLTLAHGIKWMRIHKRRRLEAQYAAPGMQAAARMAPYAESSRLEASWQLATMPVSDGKSIGAGVGVVGRF
ncbi:MAG: hypothetical protein IPL79_18215 [Myxococcales bacterium]|nr:hypothetical protein [Myxococcales bacterium]